MKNRTKKRMKNKKQQSTIGIIAILLFMLITYFYANPNSVNNTNEINPNSQNQTQAIVSYQLTDIPEYEGNPYIEIENNIPNFTEEDYKTESFENYAELDSLGRCGVAFANLSKETMPQEGDERGDISSVIPTGWVQQKYNGEYLYNRCHLIGYQLSNEDANPQNLITGTRYFNVTGMLPFENEVANYIEENEDNHVLYRVTPNFEGNNLLASGVQIEAYSIEDKGQGICFHVYIYNVQPGVTIDYATGESYLNN